MIGATREVIYGAQCLFLATEAQKKARQWLWFVVYLVLLFVKRKFLEMYVSIERFSSYYSN